MSEKIFGYEWDEIKNAQNGGKLGKSIDTSKPPAAITLSSIDKALMDRHGSVEELEANGYYGTADKYRRLAETNQEPK